MQTRESRLNPFRLTALGLVSCMAWSMFPQRELFFMCGSVLLSHGWKRKFRLSRFIAIVLIPFTSLAAFYNAAEASQTPCTRSRTSAFHRRNFPWFVKIWQHKKSFLAKELCCVHEHQPASLQAIWELKKLRKLFNVQPWRALARGKVF